MKKRNQNRRALPFHVLPKVLVLLAIARELTSCCKTVAFFLGVRGAPEVSNFRMTYCKRQSCQMLLQRVPLRPSLAVWVPQLSGLALFWRALWCHGATRWEIWSQPSHLASFLDGLATVCATIGGAGGYNLDSLRPWCGRCLAGLKCVKGTCRDDGIVHDPVRQSDSKGDNDTVAQYYTLVRQFLIL